MTKHRASRAGFVRFQQQLARDALFRGSIGAARAALRVLTTSDFAGGAAVSEGFLETLRNFRSSEEQILDAVRALIVLGPAGDR